jgi:hypothetical protein
MAIDIKLRMEEVSVTVNPGEVIPPSAAVIELAPAATPVSSPVELMLA